MIKCQKPMMLNDALEIATIMAKPVDAQGQPVTWKNLMAVDGYVTRLKKVGRA